MKKAFLFVFIALAWPFLTIFVFPGELTTQEYVKKFLNYSIIGVISAGLLVLFIHRATSFRHKVYIYGGYIVVAPWVYIFFYYLNFWIPPIFLTLIASFIPATGAFLGSQIGKNS